MDYKQPEQYKYAQQWLTNFMQGQQQQPMPTSYYNAPPAYPAYYPGSPVVPAVQQPAVSPAEALIGGLQQLIQSQKQEHIKATESPPPSTQSHVEQREQQATRAASDVFQEETGIPQRVQVKKKKVKIPKVPPKQYVSKKPSFWSPRSNEKRSVLRSEPTLTAQHTASPSEAPVSNTQQTPVARTNGQNASAANAPQVSQPPFEPPPFVLPQLPQGGYLYYCPPPPPQPAPAPSTSPTVADNEQDQMEGSQKHKIQATIYNPRQVAGDRCCIM